MQNEKARGTLFKMYEEKGRESEATQTQFVKMIGTRGRRERGGGDRFATHNG